MPRVKWGGNPNGRLPARHLVYFRIPSLSKGYARAIPQPVIFYTTQGAPSHSPPI